MKYIIAAAILLSACAPAKRFRGCTLIIEEVQETNRICVSTEQCEYKGIPKSEKCMPRIIEQESDSSTSSTRNHESFDINVTP